MQLPIITKKQAAKILNSKEKINISLNLEKTESEIEIKKDYVIIKNQKIPKKEFKDLKDNVCYIIEEGKVKKMAWYSEVTEFYYKLYPTDDWPTITLSSTPMHRHANLSPKEDTKRKIEKIKPISGNVLDTCCGLGYTAIMSSKYAKKVHTFEKDSNVLYFAEFNPYSKDLFEKENIQVHNENVKKGIESFKDNNFERIIHDPPTFKFAPELFSKEFYKKLFRVLKNKGKIYHYAPWPQKSKGRVFYHKIVNNLKDIGFKDVRFDEYSCGVLAKKI